MTKQDWIRCTLPEDLLDVLQRRGLLSERKARLFGAAVCRRIWELLDDARSRKAAEVAERFADERALGRELAVAHAAAAACCLGRPAWEPATDAAEVAEGISAPRAVAAVGSAAIAARQARASAGRPGWDRGAWDAEQRAQCDVVRDLFGLLPFRPVRLEPGWRTPLVLSLAQAAYEERVLPAGTLDPQRLAILSDALEEAGCVDPDLLGHLRGPGPHVRGCWCIDLLTGRQ
jgi:hypothetical protein